MLVHLLTTAAALKDVRVACGAEGVTHGTWVRAQVTCTACLRPPCTCSPDMPQCPACRAWSHTHRADGSKRPPPLLKAVKTEKDLQEEVRQLALAGGFLYYHTYNARHSPSGFPDVVAVRDARLVIAELKMPTNPVTALQRQWLEALAQVTRVETYLWKPVDLPTICEVLR